MFASSKTMMTLGVIMVALVSAPSSLNADEDRAVVRLAKEVATLRTPIDQEERALQLQQDAYRSQHATLAAELESLRLQAEQARARARSLDDLVTRRREEIRALDDRGSALRSPLIAALSSLRQAVSQSSPLHRDQRIERIDALRLQIESGELTPTQGLRQLVSLALDEIELSLTTQLDRAIIDVEGSPRLLPVVALGTALLYWQSEEGRVGVVAFDGKAWRATSVTSPEHVSAINALFDAERTATHPGPITLPLSGVRLQEP